MPRIRSVKPEFFTHPSVLACSIPARLLLVSLWTQADDEGRLYDQPRKIAGLAFGDADRVKVDVLLSELQDRDRIIRYSAAGRDCIQVRNWQTHQKIDRPRASSIPPLDIPEDSWNARRALVEDSSTDLGTGIEEGNQEPEKIKSAAASENGKPKGKHLGDLLNLGLVTSLLERKPSWSEGAGSLSASGLQKLVNEHGPNAVNAAIDSLYEHANEVRRPFPYLQRVASEYTEPVKG